MKQSNDTYHKLQELKATLQEMKKDVEDIREEAAENSESEESGNIKKEDRKK